MIRDDKSLYLLFIEPRSSEKLLNPIDDELTQVMEIALSKAKKGTSNYSDLDDMGHGIETFMKGQNFILPSFHENSAYCGMHRTHCGETSDCVDYLLENGMITNSLAAFYVRWYRNSISQNDMNKILELKKFYNI